jgi:hypothetical protein
VTHIGHTKPRNAPPAQYNPTPTQSRPTTRGHPSHHAIHNRPGPKRPKEKTKDPKKIIKKIINKKKEQNDTKENTKAKKQNKTTEARSKITPTPTPPHGPKLPAGQASSGRLSRGHGVLGTLARGLKLRTVNAEKGQKPKKNYNIKITIQPKPN